MNKLEEKILSKIQSDDVWLGDGTLMDNILTANISAVSIEFTKGFVEWLLKNEWQKHPYKEGFGKLEFKNGSEVENCITADGLIELYIKTL